MALATHSSRQPVHRKAPLAVNVRPGQKLAWIYGGQVPHVYAEPVQDKPRATGVAKIYGNQILHQYAK